uniref:Secreted protein n=1 Tax=Ditylenchus dipsaci TaxID=166011 RepID=A0A915DL73_9BILA
MESGSCIPNHVALLLLFLHCLHSAVSSGRSNFTRETCLSIERTNSIRRSTKIVSVSENSPAYLHCSIDGGSADSDNLVCLL